MEQELWVAQRGLLRDFHDPGLGPDLIYGRRELWRPDFFVGNNFFLKVKLSPNRLADPLGL